MFNYMTTLSGISATSERYYEASGHDPSSLLFNCMDEFLYVFCTDFFVCKQIEVISLTRGGNGGRAAEAGGGGGGKAAAGGEPTWTIRARGLGERFRSVAEGGEHEQGTEVKAITYSNLQVWEREEKTELFVIVDI